MGNMPTSNPFGEMKDENIKAVITLFGGSNCGKTAALRYLYYLLGGRKPHNCNSVDFRIKFDYGNKVILLSTIGDTEREVDINWACFREKTLLTKDPGRLGYEIETNKQKPAIAVSPTHMAGLGMRVQETNIAALRRNLVFECKYNKQSGRPAISLAGQMDPDLKKEELRQAILGDKLYK